MKKPSRTALAVQTLISYTVAGGLGLYLAAAYEPMPTKVLFFAIPVGAMFMARYRTQPASSKVTQWQRTSLSDTQLATGAVAHLQAH